MTAKWRTARSSKSSMSVHYPTSFVIDASGIIRHKDLMGESLDKAIESLLKRYIRYAMSLAHRVPELTMSECDDQSG